MSKYKLCRGFKDIMPTDYKKYDFLKNEIMEVGNVYGYKTVRLPTVEESHIFKDCSNEDITSHLLEISGKFTNNVALNYDTTISLLRSIVENKMYVDKSLPLKLMCLRNSYYYDKKNPNDLRKCEYNFACIADKSVYLDVENVLLSLKILSYLNLYGYNLKIYNFGESEDYYNKFKETLDNLDVAYEESNDIYKKDYYTGIGYVIDVDDYENVIVGGRCDNLVNIIGGVSIDCISSQVDFDKLITIFEENEKFPSFKEEIDFYIIPEDDEAFEYALYVSEFLRDIGAMVEIHYKKYDLKRLSDLLDRIDVTYSIVLDKDNAKNRTIQIRNALNKQGSVVKLEDFIKDLEKIDDEHHHSEEE